MSIVRVHPQRAQDLITNYETIGTDVRNGVAGLSPLLAEAHALLDQAGQHPLYGPMPALTTVANDLVDDGRDLNWRLDLILEGDGTPVGMSGTIRFETNPMADDPNVTLTDALIAAGLTPAQAQSAKQAIAAGADFNEAVDQEKQREFDENMANFRRLGAQAWTTSDRSPVEQAQHSLDEIRLILDTAREDKDGGNGIGEGGQVDGVWSTNDLKAIIENKHGYYTDAQIEHARTVLAMAESSPEARDYLGITQSDEGWTFTDIAHLTLDIVGMFPVVGNAADGINAAWYAAEGDYLNAALSSIGMIPVIGQAAIAAKPAIIAASAGIVFKSLDEALAWAKRWLDEAGILARGSDEAAAGAQAADTSAFVHNRSAGAAHILDPAMSKAPNPGSARYRAVMRKKRGIANVRGNGGVTGTLNPAEADLLAADWLGPGFTMSMTKKGPIYHSADKLRQYRPPSAKPNAGKYSSTGYQANYQSRNVPEGAWDNNAHIDIDPFGK